MAVQVAVRGPTAGNPPPAADHLVDRGQNAPRQDRSGHNHPRRDLALNDQYGPDCQDRGLQHQAERFVERCQRIRRGMQALVPRQTAALKPAPICGKINLHTHGAQRLRQTATVIGHISEGMILICRDADRVARQIAAHCHHGTSQGRAAQNHRPQPRVNDE